MEGIRDIDPAELERRRERYRRVWDYRPADHLPIAFWSEDLHGHSLREVCLDGGLQYEVGVRNIERLLRVLPDDYLPVARVWPGYMTIATLFGQEVFWSDNPDQAPGAAGCLIHDMDQVYGLKMPDPRRDGLMPFNLKWLDHFRRHLPPEVALTGIDLGGPINTAKDLLPTDLLYTAFYDAPEALHHLLGLAADVQAACCREIVRAAGGLERLTCIDFDFIWAPEGHKGFVSDDVCASFSPEIFRDFSRPYNNRIFRAWPGGRIHNCGPHPAAGLYLDHDPPISGLNCSFRYTRDSLPALREAFRGRGIVELMFDNGERGAEIVRGYEEAAGALAPDVPAIPLVILDGSWTDDEIRGVYEGLSETATRWAGEMRRRDG